MKEDDSELGNYDSNFHESIEVLKRRIDITRRARFVCSTRLREYFDKLQNLIIYYNIMVVIISIITLFQLYNEKVEWITYVTLSLSISLSFFATHIGGKNYKEKAIMMETNGHDLSKIYGKIEMLGLQKELDNKDVTNLYKEYERVLVNVENHESIDYLQVKKSKGLESKSDIEEITKYYKKEEMVFKFAYIFPVTLVLVMLFIPLFL